MTVVQLVAALCSTAVFRPETWAGVFRIPRDWWWHRWVSDLSNARCRKKIEVHIPSLDETEQGLQVLLLLLCDTRHDRQLSFSLDCFQRSLLPLPKIKGKGEGFSRGGGSRAAMGNTLLVNQRM